MNQLRSNKTKNKQNLTDQVKRRFHFDPKNQSNRSKMIVKNKNASEKVENCDFSSVKEKNQFNDSSWLAKLVNGIEQHGYAQSANYSNLHPESTVEKIKQQSKREKDKENQKEKESDKQKQKETIVYPTKKNSVSSVYTIQRKNSLNRSKLGHRNSVPSIGSDKKNQKKIINKSQIQNNTKKECQKDKVNDLKTAKQKNSKSKEKEKNTRKNSSLHLPKKNTHKTQIKDKSQPYTGLERDHNKFHTQASLQKNSLVSYSSIDHEENQEGIFEARQSNQIKIEDNCNPKVFLDMRKKQNPKIKPNQKPQEIIKKDQSDNDKVMKKETKKSQNQLKYKYDYQISQKQKEWSPHTSNRKKTIMRQSTPKYKYDIGEVSPLEMFTLKDASPLKPEEEQTNQFLPKAYNKNLQRAGKIDMDSFYLINKTETEKDMQCKSVVEKQDKPFVKMNEVYSERIVPSGQKLGKIRKNTQKKMTDNANRSKQYNKQNNILYINNQNERKTSQSIQTIKKSSICKQTIRNKGQIKRSIGQNINNIEVKQIPFNYFTAKQNENYNYNYTFSYKGIFQKLNGYHEPQIHNQNCFESRLSEHERIQIGPIISKVKYMRKKYSENQFVDQCMKIRLQSSKCSPTNIRANNIENRPSVQFEGRIKRQTNRNKKQYNRYSSTLQDPVVNLNPPRKYSYFCDNKKEVMTEEKQAIKNGISQQRFHCSQNKRISQPYRPLFPQHQKYIDNDKATPNKSPYLEQASTSEINYPLRAFSASQNPKSIDKNKKPKNETVKNIGEVIQNLNNKLNSYIEVNNLEDTYRKFKLDFVHLKKNMI